MDEQLENENRNARLAGWTPDISPTPPYEHGAPPEIDPELNNNGIKPTDAAPLFEETQ